MSTVIRDSVEVVCWLALIGGLTAWFGWPVGLTAFGAIGLLIAFVGRFRQ